MVVLVRRAVLEDASAIGGVHVRSWQHAYRGMIADAFLDGLDPAQRAAGWALLLAAPPSRDLTLVAEQADGTVVGFANVGPARDADAGADAGAGGTTGEVRALYLAPEVGGTGAGRALMAAAVEALAAAGFTTATLWVLEANQRARRFYALAGWARDGATQVVDLFGPPVAEVRYRRTLSPSRPGGQRPTGRPVGRAAGSHHPGR